jgi:glutathionyl-hydroquinone reductase
VIGLFAALDVLGKHLATRDFLVGERLTGADPLFPTLVRLHRAYYGALRCNLSRLADYPRLFGSTRRIHALPGIAATVEVDHVKRHHRDDHAMIDRRIVPSGPPVDFATMPAARAA